MNEDVLFSEMQHLGIITLNRPHALNALTLSMILGIQKQLLRWKESPLIHAVIIKANEGSAFCAGGDVRWLYEGRSNLHKQLEFFWHEYRLNHFIHHFGKPYIALMDGITMGGGVGISMHGSHPVASERFLFAMPETSIGFFPDVGASHLLNRCPNHLGLYLGLTGHRLEANDAKDAGLVKEVVSHTQMPALLLQLANEDLSSDAHARVEACLKNYALPLNESNPMDPIIKRCFSLSSVEDILQSLQKINTSQTHEIIRHLEKKSPLSLKVTFEQLKKTTGKSVSYCLKMDYTLAQHFMKHSDFYEGVRALLIDKDKNPNWDPDRLSLVHDRTIMHYFELNSTLQFIV